MDTHRCLALDLPGFGHSDMPSEPISIRGYAKTVDAMCDALGVERVSVVGNSMGGFIGAELTLSFSTRVDRLVLVSAAGLTTEHMAAAPSCWLAKVVSAGLPAARRYESAFVRRPRLRRAVMQGVFRYPERCRCRSRRAPPQHGQARLRAGPQGAAELLLPRPARPRSRSRC